MARLNWDPVGERMWEIGVSKGVLYKSDTYGIPWNGLTAVVDKGTYDVDPVYFDGLKFNDIVTIGDFVGTLKAFTYPEDFLYYQGVGEDQTGFYVLHQRPQRFGLSYQTEVGDDVNGLNAGYKIHILFNLTALPSDISYETISEDMEPIEFEWDLTAIPEDIDDFLPTAHIIFDSRRLDPNLLQDIESIIYGDEDQDARLPTLKGLSSFIRRWDRLIITDNGDGTWTAEANAPGVITMLDDTTFRIEADTILYLNPFTYRIWSSEKNEEDLWQQ